MEEIRRRLPRGGGAVNPSWGSTAPPPGVHGPTTGGPRPQRARSAEIRCRMGFCFCRVLFVVAIVQMPCSSLPMRLVLLLLVVDMLSIVLRRLSVLDDDESRPDSWPDAGPSGQPWAVSSSTTSPALVARANVRHVRPSWSRALALALFCSRKSGNGSHQFPDFRVWPRDGGTGREGKLTQSRI